MNDDLPERIDDACPEAFVWAITWAAQWVSMRVLMAGVLGLLPLVCLAQAAQPQSPKQSPLASPSQDGGVREVLESIVIPPIPNAPFSYPGYGVGQIYSRRRDHYVSQ